MPILQLVSIIVALLLGLVVVLRNPGDRNRWLLLLFNATVCIWIASNIFADRVGDYGLLWNRMVFVSAVLMAFMGYLMIASLANRLGKTAALWGTLLFAWFGVVLCTPFVVQGVELRIGPDELVEGLNALRGPGYIVWLFSLLATGGGLVAYCFYLSRKARGRFRAQLTVIFVGLAAMLFIGLLAGVILPLVMQSSAPANFSFLAAFAFMGAFTYAIVRQRFFDIRTAIARSLGYFLSLGIIAVFYAVAVFGLAGILFGQSQGLAQNLYYISAALFVAITFQPLKRFVDRATRKIFFHDAYDTTEVFDRLTSLLVGTVDLKSLVTRSAAILNDAVRADVLEIVLTKKDSKYAGLIAHISHMRDWPIVTDELALQHGKIAEVLGEANIAMVSRLYTRQEVVGYIVCGRKSRGDVLTMQDIELIKTASDELAVAIQNALRFEEIKDFNVTLREEVKDATSQLRQSNTKLRKLDEAKDEFISMASHQLRTPLTSVKGYISMALEGDAGKLNDQQQKLLEEAFTSAQRMVYLIGDFLNVSRIQTGKFVLEARPVNLAELVVEEIDQLQVAAQRRDIKLTYHKPSNFPPVNLDEDKMRQVIMNFIDNAIYYSKPGSTVAIELIATGSEVQLRVKDTGIGVPDNERHHLFTKFYRAANARRVRPDGTGVGLFMAKKVITAHGGSVIFESQLGKGSTFGFRMPLIHDTVLVQSNERNNQHE